MFIVLLIFQVVFFCLQMFLANSCCYSYFAFDNFLCAMNITVVGQFVILQKNMREICDDQQAAGLSNDFDVRLRFARCVETHQQLIAFVDSVKDLYRNAMLGIVVLLSFLICLEMFQIMTVSRR